MNSIYPYSQRNLIINPENYFYSQYMGIQFLFQWQNDRKKIGICQDNFSVDNFFSQPHYIIATSSIVVSSVIFKDIYLEADQSNISEKNKEIIDGILKRFEITKKIFDKYSPDMRPLLGSSDRDINLYLKFGIIIELMYTKTHDLTYLNSLLKIVDILSSIFDDLTGTQKKYSAFLVHREKFHLLELLKKLGITL